MMMACRSQSASTTAQKLASKIGTTVSRGKCSQSSNVSLLHHPLHRVNLVFGANTDVGKSIISAGLLRAAAAASTSSASSAARTKNMDSALISLRPSVNYIKPLQCGGSDESFVQKHDRFGIIKSQTLFSWETPASPHLASRWENLPVSDEEVLSALHSSLERIGPNVTDKDQMDQDDWKQFMNTTIIETAGGVLSPSSSSPLNTSTASTLNSISSLPASEIPQTQWAWSTQADLYSPLNIPTVLVGDGKLGGISVTLASLEALWSRGYQVHAVVFIEGGDVRNDGRVENDESGDTIEFGKGNAEALQEYISMRISRSSKRGEDIISSSPILKMQLSQLLENDAIVCLPPLPPMPLPLNDWYAETDDALMNLHNLLCQQWQNSFIKR